MFFPLTRAQTTGVFCLGLLLLFLLPLVDRLKIFPLEFWLSLDFLPFVFLYVMTLGNFLYLYGVWSSYGVGPERRAQLLARADDSWYLAYATFRRRMGFLMLGTWIAYAGVYLFRSQPVTTGPVWIAATLLLAPLALLLPLTLESNLWEVLKARMRADNDLARVADQEAQVAEGNREMAAKGFPEGEDQHYI